MQGWGILEFSVLLAQFFCVPKTALKKPMFKKHESENVQSIGDWQVNQSGLNRGVKQWGRKGKFEPVVKGLRQSGG